MDKLVYPAIFSPDENGGYTVTFPDLPGCITEGNTLRVSLEMANDAMGLYLLDLKEDGEPYPEVSNPSDIELEKGDFIELIEYIS